MRMKIITGVSLIALSAGMAQAGGFELQTLDTSIMYVDGNQASSSYAKIDASIEGYNTAAEALGLPSKRQVVKDQTVTNVNAKFDVGESMSFGLGTYRAGSIQLSGGNEAPTPGVSPGGNLTPTADVDMDTTALMARYNLNDNFSFIGGITQNAIKGGNVTTLAGSYDVASKSSTGYIGGVAYIIPEIALRAELTYQPKTEFTTSTAYTPSAVGICGAAAAVGADCTVPEVYSGYLSNMTTTASTTTLSLPDSLALNFQTGIAEDTLMTASYRKASWGKSQINIAAPIPITTEFTDSDAYSIGVGRKFSDNLSGSITYSVEEGSSSTSTSLFTVSNGSEAISLGVRYTRDNMNISAGISQRNVGDVTVNSSVGTMQYTGNTVTSMGVKIAFAF